LRTLPRSYQEIECQQYLTIYGSGHLANKIVFAFANVITHREFEAKHLFAPHLEILGQCQIVKTWQKRILNDMQIINIIRKFTNVFPQPLGRDRTKVCK
jgi:hypothetical protein